MTRTATARDASKLVPALWGETSIRVEEDIVFLGKATIQTMVKYWRRETDSLEGTIKYHQELLDFLKNKRASDITRLATQYENPELPLVGYWGQRVAGCTYPEPLDLASLNRQSDTTTFNVCGWCTYASGGTNRYHYTVTPSCKFFTCAGDHDENRRFNTQCSLQKASDQTFERLRERIRWRRDALVNAKRAGDRVIKRLLVLRDRAEEKPILPYWRDTQTHWTSGDTSLVYYTGHLDYSATEKDFVFGTKIDDASFSISFTESVHNGHYLGGYGVAVGEADPSVMYAWEFEYLVQHPAFARVWAIQGGSDHLRWFDSGKFLAALNRERKMRALRR